MSSESHDRKEDDSSEAAAPASRPATRVSSRAPSAWGAARDALAAVHNLEALLRSERVTSRTIRDLIPELRDGASVLREAFEQALSADDASAAVGDHGGGRVEELERLLDAASSAADRSELAERARVLAEELEASADLLAVLERAASPSSTEVSVDLVVRETGRIWGSGRGRELSVRFDGPAPDGLVTADPYVVGPLLALLVAWVHRQGSGAATVVVRARCLPTGALFVVEPAEAPDAARPAVAMRIMPCVPPTELVAQRVAEQIGASITWGDACASIVLPMVAG